MRTSQIPLITRLVVLLVFLVACSGQDEEPDFVESPSVITSISLPNSAIARIPTPINLVISGSSGCSSFSRFETISMGDTTQIEVYQKRDRNAVCTTALIDIEASIELEFTEIGKKYVKFLAPNGYEVDSVEVID